MGARDMKKRKFDEKIHDKKELLKNIIDSITNEDFVGISSCCDDFTQESQTNITIFIDREGRNRQIK
jgi:hypothetical protein